MQHRLFQIQCGQQKIVFIPGLQKLFLVPANQSLPDFIEDEAIILPTKTLPDFKFRAVQLIVNNICNLRCGYCYAEAGDRKSKIMTTVVAFAGVDKVVKDNMELGLPLFEVNIIGGEPTLSMELIREIIPHVRKRARENGLRSRIGIVTNGFFSEDVATYLLESFDYVTISMDGFASIHDRQRPTASGRGSFDVVYRNARIIYESGLTLGLRCTVSKQSVGQLPEIVTFFHESFPGSAIGIEPLHECGRCLTSGALAPEPKEYAEQLSKTIRLAKKSAIRLKSSILRFRRQDGNISFCGVNGQNFAINPEGYVSACTRVTSVEDPMSAMFYYGRYDQCSGDFIFDNDKYQQLKGLVADNIPECQNCFARFNCKGGCSIMRADIQKTCSAFFGDYCEATRAITLALFKSQLEIE